jgi:hypothetical protein
MIRKVNAVVNGVQIEFNSAEEAISDLRKLRITDYKLVPVITPPQLSELVCTVYAIIRKSPNTDYAGLCRPLEALNFHASQEEIEQALEYARQLSGLLKPNPRDLLSHVKLAEALFLEHDPTPSKSKFLELLRTERPYLTQSEATEVIQKAGLFFV